MPITEDVLRKRAEFVRTGGRGSVRRTVKVPHRSSGDEKKVQGVLKRLGVAPFNDIDEALFYRQDGTVMFFEKPKVQASMQSQCFVVSGAYDVKNASDLAKSVMTSELCVRRYTYKSGAVYEGTFDGVNRHGQGYWTHPNGEAYEGEYVKNKQDGLGVYAFTKSGNRYMGHWKEGMMHGDGIYFFSKDGGTFYVGAYAHDKKHGSGFYNYETGILAVQEWDNGKLSSEVEATMMQRVECTLRMERFIATVRPFAPNLMGPIVPESEVRTFQFPSGATYTGQYNGTKKHGNGYWVHPEGDTYEGQFEQNKHNGWGVYVIGRSGKKYVGHWGEGKMNGVGVYFFNRQETEYFIGSYRYDLKNGLGMYHFAESGTNKLQLWEDGSIKKEEEASEVVKKEYMDAMQKVIEIVRSYAPRYEPVVL